RPAVNRRPQPRWRVPAPSTGSDRPAGLTALELTFVAFALERGEQLCADAAAVLGALLGIPLLGLNGTSSRGDITFLGDTASDDARVSIPSRGKQ
ncbi:MAG: hypothetical protein ACRDSH_16935, partial [Pseudonocardiaceae bacterium]